MLELAGLLEDEGLDPQTTLVFRHKPWEWQLWRVLPWLAQEEPDTFNMYQRTHNPRTESSLKRAQSVASFIAYGAGKALFAGAFAMKGYSTISSREWRNLPGIRRLIELGMSGDTSDAGDWECALFDLQPVSALAPWKGRLIIEWTADRAYYRWGDRRRNRFPVTAIAEESLLVQAMPDWTLLDLGWAELKSLPQRWAGPLSQWRGIYLIHDQTDGRSYVGSAGGADNILGRWLNYAGTGHGGNAMLRSRDPTRFRFSILQRVSPDLPADELVAIEQGWKLRLHTRGEFGLNAN